MAVRLLLDETDGALWDAALREGCLLVTKDEDFVAWSVLRGAPPKVVWLRTGNTSTAETAAVLLQQADAIEMFAEHPDASFLALAEGASPG